MQADLGARLSAIAKMAPRAGIFTDFDGSLAPIVRDPERSRPVRGAARALHRLARRYGAVAVISGRPVRFLTKRLHARGVRMVGLYGIEERIGRHLSVLPDVQHARSSVERAVERLRATLSDIDGVFVEPKGYAVSVHFRRAEDPAAAQAVSEPIILQVAADLGLTVLVRGRLVIEIGPAANVDKGSVVRRIIEANALTAALVIGDDTGDLPMFAAVDGMDPVVRIAVRNVEAPPELFARADVTVEDPREVVGVLRGLAAPQGR